MQTSRTPASGQVIPVFALALLAIVAMGALVLEGGNAYAQQRVAQNGSDAAANAGALVIGETLGPNGATRTDDDVDAAVTNIATQNDLDNHIAYYTDVSGKYVNNSGAVVAAAADAAIVGNADGVSTIPATAQGVRVTGTRTFGTTFGRAIGFTTLDASADATAVAGRLTGGAFLPVIFPVNITDCDNSGDLGVGESQWVLSQPDGPDADTNPEGNKYIIPLCKTGDGAFQVLDLDPTLSCDEEAAGGVSVFWPVLPVDVPVDPGNDCAKKVADAVNAPPIQGSIVLIPICEVDCTTDGGANGEYTIVKITAFFIDYLHHQNGGNAAECQGDGTTTFRITGNGSSSCVVGWFVRYISSGPVGVGPVGETDAIGVQLIR
ncbi:MAG: TadE/TadG family type IV pilus assembly protein [Candidatus Limnocylindria bacterium]